VKAQQTFSLKVDAMKNVGLWAVLLVLVSGISGCGASAVPGAEVTQSGGIAFTAQGSSVVAKEGDPLALLEARIAASTSAKAKLLEKVKGAYITGSETVGDLMFESQKASSEVEGWLRSVTVSFEAPEPTRSQKGQIITATAVLHLPKGKVENLGNYVK